jgi:DNA processing protein
MTCPRTMSTPFLRNKSNDRVPSYLPVAKRMFDGITLILENAAMVLSAETHKLLALHLVPGIGARLTAALLERFGSPEAVCNAPVEQLAEVPQLGHALAGKVRQALDNSDVAAEIERMRKHGVSLLRRGEPPYPPTLATIAAPPMLLYMRGTLQSGDREAVAIVGSRHCTNYGRKIAERLAGDLARAGYTVVSGLARGIDAAAHRGALQAGGRTLAVLAGGLAKIYPPEHTALAEEVQARGALLTESAMLMEPMACMFPQRNRIISGLVRAVVVVEAAQKSGALITASHAGDQGREVFAIPGPVDSLASAGTLELLRKGAKLARHAGDIIEDLQGIAPLFSATSEQDLMQPRQPPPDLDPLQRKIWDLLDQKQYVDDIARALGLPVPELMRTLMLLEMKRAIKRLPGNQYERW